MQKKARQVSPPGLGETTVQVVLGTLITVGVLAGIAVIALSAFSG